MQPRQQRSALLSKLDARKLLLLVAACCMTALLLYARAHDNSAKAPLKDVQASEGFLRKPLRQGDLGPRSKVSSSKAAWSCPLEFRRLAFEEVRERLHIPYILGGAQQPDCRNCHKKEELWSNFCQFKSHGPTCSEWDQWQLLDGFIQRAEEGAAGMKEMLTLTPCDLFELLEGRTLWLIGDSMTQELQRALQCFFSEFWDLHTREISHLVDSSQAAAAEELPTGWCVFMERQTRICHLRINYGQAAVDEVFPALPRLGATANDLVLLNFGAWHNDLASFQGNLTHVRRYVSGHRGSLPFLIWREITPQHFDTPLGEFGCDGCPTPQGPYQCKEVTNMTLDLSNCLSTTESHKQVLVEGGWRNKLANPSMTELGLPILHLWNQSMPIWQYHHNFQEKDDCTHMCHPSAYQLWIYLLYELLLRLRDQLPKLGPQTEGTAW